MDLQQRMAGKLPEIDIAGTMFFVDIRLHELRSDYQLMSRINLDHLEVGAKGDTYLFAFDTQTKQLVKIDPAITEWPEKVVIVEIPDEVKLDPYALARDSGIDPVEFIKTHPIEKELKAKIIPLKETGFPALMEKNKKEQPLLQKKERKPGHHSRGNRIK